MSLASLFECLGIAEQTYFRVKACGYCSVSMYGLLCIKYLLSRKILMFRSPFGYFKQLGLTLQKLKEINYFNDSYLFVSFELALCNFFTAAASSVYNCIIYAQKFK